MDVFRKWLPIIAVASKELQSKTLFIPTFLVVYPVLVGRGHVS